MFKFIFAAALPAAFLLSVNGIATADTPSPLTSAKTIQVHEVMSIFNKDQKMIPFFDIDLKIAGPDHVKGVFTRDTDAKTANKHQYVDDGTTEREYNALQGTYETLEPKTDGHSHSQLRDVSDVDLLLNGGPLPASASDTRTTSTGTLDGVDCTVTTDTGKPRTGTDGTSYTFSRKVWIDSKTGLPIQDSQFVTSNGATHETQRLTFSDWQLNTAIPDAEMAWAPPADAKAYTEPKLLAVGTPAPDFSVITPAGKTVHLSDFKGKPVIVDFWATWCGPCQMSMPHLNTVYKGVKDQGVQVLAVCVWDKKDAYEKWVTAKKDVYSFPTYFDTAKSNDASFASKQYDVTGIPTQYVIDKDGKVAATNVGYEEGDHKLEDELAKMGINVPKVTASADVK